MSRTEGIVQTGPLPSWEDAHRMERASRVEGNRRTAEAQDQINAARAAPTEAELDAQLSDAALQATPAVQEMGGTHWMQTLAAPAAAVHPADLAACAHAMFQPGCERCVAERHRTGPPPDSGRWVLSIAGDWWNVGARSEPPPDAIVLTGPEAERYRALQTAARAAQDATRTAKTAGAKLLELFQAFCAGVTP